MCGIAGIVRYDGKPVDTETVAAITAARAPGTGRSWRVGRRLDRFWPSAAFDHRLKGFAAADGDGRLHVSFSGEILNYREVRSELQYPFRTSGDTETLLAAFLAHGPSFVERLAGQSAFAIQDRSDGSVWLYRDRLGILPLYYWLDDHGLVFAYEIKVMFPALPQRPKVDPHGLAAYLAHRSVPAPGTLFQGVRKLKPGHRLHVMRDGSLRQDRWWSIPDKDTSEVVSGGVATRLVSRALRESVERNLVADVPVGAYLSGGVDSSLTVALMTELVGSEKVHTFSAGFADPEYDEVRHALRVSVHLGTVHHEVAVTLDEFERLWPCLTWHRDAPVSEPADIAVFRLAELTGRHVKVVLSGQGSDELFPGYPKYRFARASAIVGAIPNPLRVAVMDYVERRMPSRFRRARIALRALRGKDEAERSEGWFAPFASRERTALQGAVERRAGVNMAIGGGG